MKREWNAAAAHALRRWVKGSNIRRLSRLTGFSKSLIYGWLEEVAPVPVYAPPRIQLVLPNWQAYAEVTGVTTVGGALVPTQTPLVVGDVRDEMMDVGSAAGEAMAKLKAALQDRVITDAERRELRAALDEVIRQAEEAKQALDGPALVAVRR